MHHQNLSYKKGVAGPPTPVSILLSHCGWDPILELQLEDWLSLRPKRPSRSRAIRFLLRNALAAEQEREDSSSDQKTAEQEHEGPCGDQNTG
jgi:hypothetical protein